MAKCDATVAKVTRNSAEY